MEPEHGVRQDHREGFTDDWTAVEAELEGQSSTNLQRWTALWSQTLNNLHLGPLPESQNSSQKAEASFDFGAASAPGLLRYLDSDYIILYFIFNKNSKIDQFIKRLIPELYINKFAA